MKFLVSLLVVLSFGSLSLAMEPDVTSTTEANEKVPVPTGKYITGGILGTAVGFGIGHGIQGRYAEKGWIFTVGEAVGTAAFLAAASTCKTETKANGDKETECKDGGLGILGLGAMLGFHIWEIVDVWTGATPVDTSPKVFLMPNPEAPGIGVALTF